MQNNREACVNSQTKKKAMTFLIFELVCKFIFAFDNESQRKFQMSDISLSYDNVLARESRRPTGWMSVCSIYFDLRVVEWITLLRFLFGV